MFGSVCGCLRFGAIKLASKSKTPNGISLMRTFKPVPLNSQAIKDIHTSSKLLCVADGGVGTHKPTPFQRKVFVWTKVYATDAEIPDRVTRSQMKNTMDRFRVRACIVMVALTFFFSAIMALVGRKERKEGHTITKLALSRRQE